MAHRLPALAGQEEPAARPWAVPAASARPATARTEARARAGGMGPSKGGSGLELARHRPHPGGEAAVDDEVGAVDEGRLVRGEEGDSGGDVLRLADAADRVPAGELVEELRVVLEPARP